MSEPEKEKEPAPEIIQIPKAEHEALQKKADEYLNLAKQVKADFENYQKRVARDRQDAAKYATERLLGDLLPALDAFDLATRMPKGGGNMESFVQGMELAEREIFRMLELHGLKRISTKGEFQPGAHEALMKVETDKAAPGEIVEELRPGYMLHDRILRPAQVSVAAKPEARVDKNPD